MNRKKTPKPVKKDLYIPDKIPTQREILELSRKLLLKEDDTDRLDPSKLSSIQIDSIIEYFRYSENTSIGKLAIMLDLSKSSVYARVRRIDTSYKVRVLSAGVHDPETRLSELLRIKEIAQQKAMTKGNWSAVWKMETDTIVALEKLGFVGDKKSINPTDDYMVIDAEFVDKINNEETPLKSIPTKSNEALKAIKGTELTRVTEEPKQISSPEEKKRVSKEDIYKALQKVRGKDATKS